MKKVWIYTITFYHVDDEYGHQDWEGTYVEAFPSQESAEKFKKDFENEQNLRYISGKNLGPGCYLYDWYYNGSSFNYSSKIEEKEIINY